jgi:hypothetical protein
MSRVAASRLNPTEANFVRSTTDEIDASSFPDLFDAEFIIYFAIELVACSAD